MGYNCATWQFWWPKRGLMELQTTVGLLLLLAGIFDGHRQSVAVTAKLQPSNLEDALLALEKSIGFYAREYHNVNLDSIFGLRLCQGALHKGIQMASLKNKYFVKIQNLHSQIKDISGNGYKQLKESGSKYFQQFEFLIKDEWFFMLPYHSYEKSLVQKSNFILEDSLNEAVSDKCMTGLVGIKNSIIKRPCTIDDECWKVMFSRSKSGYHLTHQALYIMLAEKHGCKSKIMQKLGGFDRWNDHINYLGANIYHQMDNQYKHGFVNENSAKDLFIEQVVVCQLLGVLECFNQKYLSLLLKWQDDSGCWKEKKDEDLIEEDSSYILGNALSRKPSRKLHEEKVLYDGCASHFSGVATGTLGTYIFWFLNPPGSRSEMAKEEASIMQDVRSNISMQGSLSPILFNLQWVFIFLFVTISFYCCRKSLRNILPRKYNKFNV